MASKRLPAAKSHIVPLLASDPAHIFYAYMIMAIIPLVSDNYPGAQGSFVSTHIMAQSLKVLEKVFSKEDGIDIIHCLHLLVIFSTHSSTAGSSWHLIGIAMKKCIALGYHREPAKALAPEEADGRRWAFWSCYLLDRLISAALGRPPSISDRYVTVSLPTELSSSANQAAAQSMQIHLLRYAVLMSSVISHVSERNFEEHLGELLHWRISTPSHVSTLERERGYQTSLYNTLLLRIIIDQIGSQRHLTHSQSSPHSQPMLLGVSVDTTQDRTSTIQARIRQSRAVRLMETCKAVVESLGRWDMRKRAFLSWVTGYSAFSTSLAVLYHITLDMPQNRDVPGLPHALTEEEPNSAANRMLNDMLQTLAIVARQFPRMTDFRRIIVGIRKKIDGFELEDWDELRQLGNVDDVDSLVADIQPDHLRKLAQVALENCNI
jgi:hypothetical protein